MMKKIRKFAALVLTLCVLASLAAPALAASGVQSELQDARKKHSKNQDFYIM